MEGTSRELRPIRIIRLYEAVELILAFSILSFASVFWVKEDILMNFPLYRYMIESMGYKFWLIGLTSFAAIKILAMLTRDITFRRTTCLFAVCGWLFISSHLFMSHVPNAWDTQSLVFAIGSAWVYWRLGLVDRGS